MLWRNPIDLGGNVRGTPAIAGWTSRSVSVAVGGPSGNVKLGWRDENGWGGLWEDIGLPTADAPAIAFVDDAPYIFVRGLNGHLWVGGTVAVARDLGGDVQSAPSVAQWRLDHDAHIFVRNAGNTVSHFMWSPGTSGHWQSIGGQILGSPAAVAWGPDRLDVVAQSADTLGLVHCSWDGKNWSNWEDRGGVLDGAPCVVSRDIGQLEVYYNDSNTDQLTTRSFDGVNWSNAKAIGPATEGTPTAFSFGPHHVEVLSKSTTGSLILAYQEGARPGDDPAGSPPAAGPFANSPSATATATTIMHCVARGENGYLRHIKYEDGFWGNWSEFRDIQIVGDPVIVCPLPGVLDLVVQVSGNEILGNRILRRRFTGGVWSAWSDTFGRTRDHIAALVQVDGTTHFLVRGTDNHLYEGVVNLDGTWAPWRDLGGTMLSRPHVIEVRENLLPRPSADAIGPAFAIPAGPYVCTLGMDGRTAARQSLNAVDWGAWAPFADGNAFIARPLIVTWKWGFPTAYPGLPLVEVANAGWIGRTAAEEIQVFAQFWREHEEAGSIVTLDTIGWKTFPPSMATDPIGLTMVDEDGSDRPWGFALKGDGRVHGADLVSPATLHSPIDWQPLFDGPADGEPALLILWERYEDAMLFRVVIVSADGRLQVLCGSNDNILPPFPPQVGPQPSRSRMIFPPPLHH